MWGIFFVGATPPITNQNFVQVDPQHWVRQCLPSLTARGAISGLKVLLPGQSGAGREGQPAKL